MRDAAIDLLERDEQLRRLGDAFAIAREGRGRIIAIAAEAGAGKTALTEQFVANHAQVARMYWGACENLSTPEVLLPLRDIARASGESFDLGADHIRSFESLLRLLSDGAKPSLLVIEDVHWADTATLDLIRSARIRARWQGANNHLRARIRTLSVSSSSGVYSCSSWMISSVR